VKALPSVSGGLFFLDSEFEVEKSGSYRKNGRYGSYEEHVSALL
jgi:hypothetical protein